MSSYAHFVMPAIAAGFMVRLAVQSRSRQTKRGAAAVRAVAIDPAYGDEELRRLRELGARGDWPAMAAILAPLRERGDYDRLTFLIGGLDEVPAERILPLAAAHPDDPLVRTVVGGRQVAYAWEARGGRRADQTSQEQFKLLHERLIVAEEHLYAAVELDPESAAPWYWLITAARGLEHGQEVARRRFDAGTRRAPFHRGMHQTLLQQLCPKWGGSYEELHGFVAETLAKAPDGTALGILAPIAHFEHYADLPAQEREGYIRNAEVLADLRAAAAKSVDHPAYAPTAAPYLPLNAFAMLFWMAGDRESANRLFRRIGDNATGYPWEQWGDPGKTFARARTECKKRK